MSCGFELGQLLTRTRESQSNPLTTYSHVLLKTTYQYSLTGQRSRVKDRFDLDGGARLAHFESD
jgi:hypothetical protein